MLEILVIAVFAKQVQDIADRKGYSGGLFAGIFVGLWFIGEALGIVIAISSDMKIIPAGYGMALGFALFGGFIGYMIAIILPVPMKYYKRKQRYDMYGQPIDDDDESPRKRRRRKKVKEDRDDYEPRSRSRREDDDRDDDRPRRRPRSEDDEDQDDDQPRRRRRYEDEDDRDDYDTRIRRKRSDRSSRDYDD